MDETTVDTIRIEVESDNSGAIRGLDRVANTLERINSIAAAGEKGPTGLETKLEKIAAAANKIQPKRITKVANAFKSFESLGKIRLSENIADRLLNIGAAVDALKDVDMSKLTELANGLSAVQKAANASAPKNADDKARGGVSASDLNGEADVASTQVKDIGFAAYFAGTKFDWLAKKAAAAYSGIKSGATKVGTALGSTFSGLITRVKSLFTMFKRRILYRAMNAIITAVTTAFKEGVSAVYQYSKTQNGAFAKSMDELATRLNTLTGTLGALGAQFLTAINPAINGAIDKLVDFSNGLTQVFAYLAGSSTWTKAIRVQKEYAAAVDASANANKRLKQSFLGIDEINTFQTSDTTGESTFKFEEVAVDATAAGAKLEKLKTILVGIVGIFAAIKGYQLISNLKKVSPLLSTISTRLLGAGGVVVGMQSAYTSAKALTKALSTTDHDGLGTAIAGLVGGVAMGAIGGAMVGGPVGALIGGLAALATSLFGAVDAQADLYNEMRKESVYKTNGTALSKVTTAVEKYLGALKIDIQGEWLKKIEESETAYKNAKDEFDLLWGSLSSKKAIDTTEIDNLRDSFNALAGAAKNLSNAKIDSLMQTIASGIEMNITPDLQETLGGLITKLEEAKAILGQKFSDLSQEYSDILTEVDLQGGVATADQKARLADITSQIAKTSLATDDYKAVWSARLDEYLRGAINAGNNKDAVLSNIKELASARDSYLSHIDDKRQEDRATLFKLFSIDEELFGGALGLAENKEQYLASLDSTYDAQKSAIVAEYNAVLDKIKSQFVKAMPGYENYLIDNGFLDFLDTVQNGAQAAWNWMTGDAFNFITGSTGGPSSSWNVEYAANKKQAKDIDAIVKAIDAEKYASGGFPETGQLFVAREAGPELVGSIGGKTAVANNDQIVESVSIGVRNANEDVVSAVWSAAQQLIQAVRENDSDIYLDGEKVGKKVTESQNRNCRMYGKTLQKA